MYVIIISRTVRTNIHRYMHKQGYTDILSRIDLFNRHMKTISTAMKSLRDNANELTKKKTCKKN